MSQPEKDKCWGCNLVEIEITMCCNGHDCGCRGMPTDPPFCSQECWDAWGEAIKEKDDEPSTT